jgi:S-sulfo-L-cysteine synthase (3-phospho-L-serine-dependent)
MTKNVVFVGFASNGYLNQFLSKGYNCAFFSDANNQQHGEIFSENTLPYLNFMFPVNMTSLKTVKDSFKNVYIHPDTTLVTVKDMYFYPAAKIAHSLGLHQSKLLSMELAVNVTNKIYQRKVFEKNCPEISTRFKKIRTFHSAYTFARKIGFPVVVKPANLSQSQMVYICKNLEELIQKVSYVLDHIASVYREQKIPRSPQVIIEEFIQGRQYSIDSYIDMNGKVTHTPVCQQMIGYDLGLDNFDTICSFCPSNLNQKEIKLVEETVNKAVTALELKGQPTHTEIKITPDGQCKIIEVNVRTGGHRDDLLEHSYGIHHLSNTVKNYIGEPLEVNKTPKAYTACPQFRPEKEGVISAITGFEEVAKLPSYIRHNISKHIGSEAGPASKGYPKAGFCILSHPDKDQLFSDIEKAREFVKFEVE